MKKRHIALAALAFVGVGGATAAYVATPTVHEGSPGEVPELGRPGDFKVGTQEMTFALRDRVTFGKLDMATGGTQTETRELQVRVYYPANPASGAAPIAYSHTMEPPGMEPIVFDYEGRSFADATPVDAGEYADQFPLVVMSHGFNGWSTQFSNLAEHIASRGYVVASIDHADMKLEGATDFLHSFAKVLASRSLDQRQVLAQILDNVAAEQDGPFALVDAKNIGMIGYSMGGYGALASAGGDYDYDSSTFDAVPDDAMAPVRAAADAETGIDAVIAFAPWGGQPDNRVWSSQGLAGITVPVLLVSGAEDDVSNFDEGVSWIFDQLSATNRHMLVYRNARHNIVGNALSFDDGAPFRAIEFMNEPVWRQDRINGINQHFVAAFLDRTLKGDEAMDAYLNVPTVDSNDGTWDIGFGEQLNGTVAGDEAPNHWRGFQRRWALGLEMRRKAVGE
ncbi:alpha/beta hydrolase family protein [Erythrobacter sp. Alg231-14]|uniref:alpha/beta hydrolase family protein n=1 Tax=Erythrobacter sp. Alg231-14 TaxID=1922225 RepID=UPI00307B21B2